MKQKNELKLFIKQYLKCLYCLKSEFMFLNIIFRYMKIVFEKIALNSLNQKSETKYTIFLSFDEDCHYFKSV